MYIPFRRLQGVNILLGVLQLLLSVGDFLFRFFFGVPVFLPAFFQILLMPGDFFLCVFDFLFAVCNLLPAPGNLRRPGVRLCLCVTQFRLLRFDFFPRGLNLGFSLCKLFLRRLQLCFLRADFFLALFQLFFTFRQLLFALGYALPGCLELCHLCRCRLLPERRLLRTHKPRCHC